MIIALHVILTFLMPEFGWLWLAMKAVISAIALFSSTEVTSCAEAIIRTVQSSKHRVKRVIFMQPVSSVYASVQYEWNAKCDKNSTSVYKQDQWNKKESIINFNTKFPTKRAVRLPDQRTRSIYLNNAKALK